MKIAYRFGHMINTDQGANGVIAEYEFNRLYGAKVVEYIKSNGDELLNCTPVSAISMEDSLKQGVDKANSWGADLFISFHGNAFDGNAKGSEVICGSQKGIDIGTRIINNLANLGFTKRRSYIDKRGLYEIKNTSMVAIIIEPLFVDNKADVDLFNKIGADTFAKAIAEAIINKSIPKEIPTTQIVSQTTSQVPKVDNNVLQIQKILNRLQIAKLVEDGILGNKTTTAIKKFQSITNTTTDGIIGQNTSFRINEILGKPFVDINHATKTFAIMYIQWRVGTVNDGIFGMNTLSALKAWQKVNGLVADGQVGILTWNRMIG